jgi:hypothetical protein
MPGQYGQFSPYYIVIPVVLIILVLRLRSMSKGQRLRVELMWITPLLLLVGAGLLLAQAPPAPEQWIWLAVPLILGAALGWYRGKMMHIEVDPETQALKSRASPAALYLIVAIIVLRYALSIFARTEAAAWKVSPMFITDLFMMFGVGVLSVARIEMMLRARRLLAEPGRAHKRRDVQPVQGNSDAV